MHSIAIQPQFQLIVDPKYFEVLRSFGNVEEIFRKLIHDYTVEQVNQRIGKIKQELTTFEKKYGLPYQEFYHRVATDQEFLTQLNTAGLIWELDINAWEYCVEELTVWHGRLKDILQN